MLQLLLDWDYKGPPSPFGKTPKWVQYGKSRVSSGSAEQDGGESGSHGSTQAPLLGGSAGEGQGNGRLAVLSVGAGGGGLRWSVSHGGETQGPAG